MASATNPPCGEEDDESDMRDGSGYSKFAANELVGQRYRIISRLGGGSFAEVYLCTDIKDENKDVKLALKVIRFESEFRKACKDEVRFLLAVKHGTRMPELLDYFTIRMPVAVRTTDAKTVSACANAPPSSEPKQKALYDGKSDSKTTLTADSNSTIATAASLPPASLPANSLPAAASLPIVPLPVASLPDASVPVASLPPIAQKCRRYRCLVFPSYQLNLYEFVKGYAKKPKTAAATNKKSATECEGIPSDLIQILGWQLLEGLDFLVSAKIPRDQKITTPLETKSVTDTKTTGTAQIDIGLVHCDIKPANIMIDVAFPNEDRARLTLTLIDFGSACQVEQLNENYRRRMEVLQRKRRKPPKPLSREDEDLKYRDWWFGPYLQSRFYRAPETILGNSLGPPIEYVFFVFAFVLTIYMLCVCSWFSAGTVLWEMATGRALFRAKTPHHLLWLYTEVMGSVPTEIIESMNEYAREYFFHVLPGTNVWSLRPWTGSTRFIPFSRNLSLELIRCGWVEKEAESFSNLIGSLLNYDPKRRMSPSEALAHEFFVSR